MRRGTWLRAEGIWRDVCARVYQHSHLHSTRQPPAAPVWTAGVSLESFRASFTVLRENR